MVVRTITWGRTRTKNYQSQRAEVTIEITDKDVETEAKRIAATAKDGKRVTDVDRALAERNMVNAAYALAMEIVDEKLGCAAPTDTAVAEAEKVLQRAREFGVRKVG